MKRVFPLALVIILLNCCDEGEVRVTGSAVIHDDHCAVGQIIYKDGQLYRCVAETNEQFPEYTGWVWVPDKDCETGSFSFCDSENMLVTCEDKRWKQIDCKWGCSKGQCLLPPGTDVDCSPDGDIKCIDDSVHICQNGRWEFSQACSYGCEMDIGCLAPTCEENESKCADEKTRAVCTPNSSEIWSKEPCQGTEICQDGQCIEPPCQDHSRRCSGNNVEVCLESIWVREEICKDGCTKGQCSERICESGFLCKGKDIYRCDNDVFVKTCPTACAYGDCPYDEPKALLQPSEHELQMLYEEESTFNVAYLLDYIPQPDKVLNIQVSNPDCIHAEKTAVTGPQHAVISIDTKGVAEDCSSEIIISDALSIAEPISVSVEVLEKYPPVDINHNYMDDIYDLQPGEYDYNHPCRSHKNCKSGFCDSFIGYKCANKCTSDEQCISEEYFCRKDGRCAPKTFESIWKTETDNATMLFPISRADKCDFVIDWGDGSPAESVGECYPNDIAHTYAKAGGHAIKITGTLDGWKIAAHTENIPGENLQIEFPVDNPGKLQRIVTFGPVGIGKSTFSGYIHSYTFSEKDIPDASKLTTTRLMFMNYTTLPNPFNERIENWDVSNVTDMSYMFVGTKKFNRPIGKWDVSNVTDMHAMFVGAEEFNQPIDNWLVSNVTDMGNMFFTAEKFNQPIGNWKTSSVTDMNQMFEGATKFNQPIGKWNTSNVKSMFSMFEGAAAFNQNIGTWDTSNVTYMNNMFKGAAAFNQNISSWNTSNVKNMASMFEGAAAFNQNISSWNTSNAEDINSMFKNAKAFDQDLSQWDLSKIPYNSGYDYNYRNIFQNSGLSKENYCKMMADPNSVWLIIKESLGISFECE